MNPYFAVPQRNGLRRRDLAALAASALVLPGWACAASGYPAHPVRLVNCFPPGGPSDILARSVAEVLQQTLGQPFIVDNRPGAAGNLGTDAVAKSPADGYTVQVGIDTIFTVNPHLYHHMPFKMADFRPLRVMASSGLLVGVNPAAGLDSLKALLAAGRQRVLNFSSGGSGSPGHLAVGLLQANAGLKINHIPYKGNTPAVTAVMAGEVDGGVLAIPGMLPYVKAGRIKALAVTSHERSPMAPDIPTVAELGLPELELEVLYIAMLPAATPDAVVQVLQQGFAQALSRPEVQARLKTLDLRAENDTGESMGRRLALLSDRYRKIIQATGIQVE